MGNIDREKVVTTGGTSIRTCSYSDGSQNPANQLVDVGAGDWGARTVTGKYY